jgi:hypothetical protein
MSLTAELEAGRPARRYLDRRFGEYLKAARRSLPPDTRARLRGLEVTPPASLQGGARGTVGTAFDYRARYYFEAHPAEPMAAHYGAALWCGRCDARLAGSRVRRLEADPSTIGLPPRWRASFKLVRQFFAHVDDVVAELDPVAHRLDDDAEETLARCCLVLALLEQLYRAGNSLWFESPLYWLGRKAGLEDLIAVPEPDQVADLCALSKAFYEDEADLLERRVVCNPSFSGSPLVNGADADLVVDDCLIELKTSARVVSFADWLRQLLGYVLLDFDDVYGIRRVAVYAARMRTHVSFDLLDIIGDRPTDGQEMAFEERLKALRSEFRSMLRTGRFAKSFAFTVKATLKPKPPVKRQRLSRPGDDELVVLFTRGSLRDQLVGILDELGGVASTYDVTLAAWERPGALSHVHADQVQHCLRRCPDDFERVSRGVYRLKKRETGA